MTVRIEEFTMRTGIVCAALGGLLWTATWSGAAEAPAVKKEGPQAQQFSQIFTEWKETLSKMRQLHEEYTDAKPERRKAIKKEYDELLKKGAALEPKLFDAAEKASARSWARATASAARRERESAAEPASRATPMTSVTATSMKTRIAPEREAGALMGDSQ